VPKREDFQMTRNKVAPFFLIAAALLVIDSGLGAGCAAGKLPHLVFFLANIPFGGIYVWMESQWVGTHYVVFGRRVGDLTSLIVFLGVVFAQACVYFGLWNIWRNVAAGFTLRKEGDSHFFV